MRCRDGFIRHVLRSSAARLGSNGKARHFGWRDALLTIALNAANASPAPFFYGGQAVIEGVLMRGPRHYAIAVRRPDGGIALRQEELKSKFYNHPLWSKPFLRGIIGLIEMFGLGYQAMAWAANIQLGKDVEISRKAVRGTVFLAVIFALLLFVVLPLFITRHATSGSNSVSFAMIEGVVRAGVLLGYLWLIGQFSSVRRVFAYHGAEHKAINCLEKNHKVDIEHVQEASRLHPRCGTGFIVVVALISIIVFAPLTNLPLWVLLASRVILVPVIAGLAYETIRALAKARDTSWGQIALAPILATQLLTTREPSDDQVEVSITALKAAQAGDSFGVVTEGSSQLVT